ncbi:caspase-8-like [Etheostoma cragini]|uniref:caspase-8-like n=1 Tax=Etheostoma cragini TaxID=417921 RepID=UPI00155F2259|nr:caspase-8-like [Etheostoma cragini]
MNEELTNLLLQIRCAQTSALFKFNMSATDMVRRNKTAIQTTLCGDYRLILNKVHENELITKREYNNLKSINKEDVEGHVIELVDKIMNKGENTCKAFLDLLQTDEGIKTTYPELKNIQLNKTSLELTPVQEGSLDNRDVQPQESKRRKEEEQYELNSQPTGLCVIINNENFPEGARNGTDKDAQSLAEVFSWLGFRVLMCKDQTKNQMDRALKCFASQSNLAELQGFNVTEWSGSSFTDLQEDPKHGDAFICCILSHGMNGEVLGIDEQPLSIKQITRTFKASDQSTLTGKPKVFLIQACQGLQIQHGVLEKDLLTDDDSHSPFIPEEADVLVAIATVEDHKAFRHKINGSWFIQSVCQQLKEGCPRSEDITTILHRVNNEVAQKEGCTLQPGEKKQMPEVRFTLRKRLVLSPHHK